MQQLEQWIAKISTLSDQSPLIRIVCMTLLTLLVSWLVWLIIRLILRSVRKKLSQYEFFQKNETFFGLLRKVAFLGLVMVSGTYLIQLYGIEWLRKLFYGVMIILVASPLRAFLTVLIGYLELHLASKTETRVDDILFELLNRFSGVLIYATAIVIALDSMGVNVMPFVAGAGVAGVAIGFAAKDTLSNLIAGVLLIIDRPFEVGDRIELWNAPKRSATWGDVIDIGMRATKIRNTDNIIVIIPNNEIMMRDIINYTIMSQKIRVRVNVGIAYDADLKKAKEIILRVAKQADWVLQKPEPWVVVVSFGDSSVDLQLRVWIKNARRRSFTIDYMTDRIKEAFDAEGIEIPYPKRDVYIKTDSADKVKPISKPIEPPAPVKPIED